MTRPLKVNAKLHLSTLNMLNGFVYERYAVFLWSLIITLQSILQCIRVYANHNRNTPVNSFNGFLITLRRSCFGCYQDVLKVQCKVFVVLRQADNVVVLLQCGLDITM